MADMFMAELRASQVRLTDRIDRRLAVIVGASLAVHVAIAAWAWTRDAGVSLLDPPVGARFEQATIDVSDVIAPPMSVQRPAAAIQVAPPARIVQSTRVVVPIHSDQPVRLADAAGLGAVLATPETGRRPIADLAHQLDEAREAHVTIGNGTPTSREGHDAIATDEHGLPIHEATTDRMRAPEAAPERGRVQLEGAKPEERTSLTAQAILDRNNAVYMAGLQRCYRRGLALDAQLSGRVAIELTVNATGRVVDPDATGADPQVDRCIASQMASWRFAIPRDATGAPTETTFHVSLALQPS